MRCVAQVEPAPHPEDIVWENLSFSRANRILIQVRRVLDGTSQQYRREASAAGCEQRDGNKKLVEQKACLCCRCCCGVLR